MPNFEAFQAALECCMATEPPKDFVLSSDASQLATVYADMVFHKQTERSIDVLTDKQRKAFVKWSGDASIGKPNSST